MKRRNHAREALDDAPASQAGEGPGEVPARALQLVAIARIVENRNNPRQHSDKERDAELLASVRQMGVLQPLLVRPHRGVPYDFALVCGHRRLRAAIAAGLSEIPVVVRDLTDEQALEAALVENAQRVDVDPLDEAEAFRRLHTDHGRSIDEIAAKVGKSRGTIYARLKLLDLAKPARELLAKGALDPSRALLLARIPASLQEKAAKEIAKPQYGREPMSYRAARDHIEHNYMLRLKDAPWKLDDAELVAKAGPCTTCPKRSGNQAELFDAGEAKDLCTDGACFQAKRAAHTDRILAEAEATGARVVKGAAARKIVDQWGSIVDRSLEKLDSTCHADPKYRTYRQLLKKSDIDRVVVEGARGGVIELVPKAGLNAALKKAGHKFEKKKGFGVGVPSESWARKQRIDRRAGQLFLDRLLPQSEWLTGQGTPLWAAIADALLSGSDTEGACTRRGLVFKKYHSDSAIEKFIEGAGLVDLQTLVVELVVGADFNGRTRRPLADLANIDLKALDGEAKTAIAAEEKAQRDAKKAMKKQKAAKPDKSKRTRTKAGTCRVCKCTDSDCSQCIEKTGEPCTWIEPDLCSACAEAA